MPKICNYESCNNVIFSGGYCYKHQSCRNDEKYKQAQRRSAERVTASKLRYAESKKQVKREHTGKQQNSNSTDKGLPKRIANYSAKRQRINNNEYSPKARKYVQEHPICNIKSPVCTIHAQCVNHRKGKNSIAMLLDEKFWEASCFACNNWIEDNDKWAREHGHKLSKFN